VAKSMPSNRKADQAVGVVSPLRPTPLRPQSKSAMVLTNGIAGEHLDNAAAGEDTMERGARCHAGVPLKLKDFLPYQLNLLANLVSEGLSLIYAERFGISIPEWRVLVTLGEFNIMTGKDIGAHTHMHKTKVSRAVADLERRKLVSRRVNRADLREAFLSLTPSGRAIYEELAPGALEFARKLAEAIDPADRAAFERALTQLTERSKLLASDAAEARERNDE
jgi:DNA-binding MarR family transcriptional regulator